MLDIVTPNQNKLPLAVEAERVDEAEPRLTRPGARNAQSTGERQSVDNRQHHQSGYAAGRQEPGLKDPIVGERKIT
jgi:hypothetical protein